MNRPALLLFAVAVVVSGFCTYVGAKCCPPPPTLSRPVLSLPVTLRTTPPLTSKTLPPQTILPGGSTPAIIEPDLTWEDWMDDELRRAMVLYDEFPAEIVAEYKPFEPEETADQVDRLLGLLATAGMLQQGIHRIAAIELNKLGDEAVERLRKIADGETGVHERNSLKFLNRQKYEMLAVYALGLVDSEHAREALQAMLIRIPTPATALRDLDETLRVLSQHKDREKRFWAVLALGRSGSEGTVELLRDILLNEKDKYVRSAAAVALAMNGTSDAIEALQKGRKQSRSFYHAKAFTLASLGYMGAEDPLSEIEASLASEAPYTRAAACFALAHYISRKAERKLPHKLFAQMLQDALWTEEDKTARLNMTFSLFLLESRIVQKRFAQLMMDWRDPKVSAVAAVAFALNSPTLCADTVPLIEADKIPEVENARAYAMALSCTTKKTKLASDMVDSEFPLVRALGLFCLSRLDTEKAARRVRTLRYDDSAVVRNAVAVCSGLYFGDEAERTVRKMLTGDHYSKALSVLALGVRCDEAALDTISGFDPGDDTGLVRCRDLAKAMMGAFPVSNAVMSELESKNEKVRAAGYYGIGLLDIEDHLYTVLKASLQDKRFRARAYAAFASGLFELSGEHAEDTIKALVEIVEDDRHFTPRCCAALALARHRGNMPAYDAILRTMQDKHNDVKAYGAIAMGLHGGTNAKSELLRMISASGRSPVGSAGYLGLGLLREGIDVNTILEDFKTAVDINRQKAMSFAIGRNVHVQNYYQLLKILDGDNVYAREYATKALAMAPQLPLESRREICLFLKDKLEATDKRDRETDPLVRFYNGIARYALGDRAAIEHILKAMQANDFYLNAEFRMGWQPLMDWLSRNNPPHYHIKPFFWSDTD